MNIYMTDEMIQVTETPTIIEDEKPKKERKKRAPMSAEKKEKLLANLAKAREKAAANRKAKKEAKESALPPKKMHALPVTEVRSKPAKVTKPAELDPRDIELAQLRERVKTMTLQDVIKKPKKRVKKEKQSAATSDTEDEVNEVLATTTHQSPQKTVRAISPTPSPPAPTKQTPPTKVELKTSLPQTPVNIAPPLRQKKQLFGRGKKRR